MWMTDYVRQVKYQLRDKYGFPPLPGSTEEEPLLNVPDGKYPMTIEGKTDEVRIVNGTIYCCNNAS